MFPFDDVIMNLDYSMDQQLYQWLHLDVVSHYSIEVKVYLRNYTHTSIWIYSVTHALIQLLFKLIFVKKKKRYIAHARLSLNTGIFLEIRPSMTRKR